LRILLASRVGYPGDTGNGSGLSPKPFPSGSFFHIHHLIAKGLAELGHCVFYRAATSVQPLPAGVEPVFHTIPAVDILHTLAFEDEDLVELMQLLHTPLVTTCHGDVQLRGRPRRDTGPNWIFVSRSLARLHGRTRFVLNGLDPSELTYSSSKADYVLFLASMDRAIEKGLDLAILLAKQKGFHLVVAGTAGTQAKIERVAEICKAVRATYLGDVRGTRKAELLAAAKALLVPSRLDEGFGLTLVEAMMSGTPVICSDKGAFREIVSSDVGFICGDWEDYLYALDHITEIDPSACRERALSRFHYIRMARDYAEEYVNEINRCNQVKLMRAVEVIRAHSRHRVPRHQPCPG